MGTRNLTMVINQEGETKVAQYGQWDGYPDGVGVSVLEFLSNKELFNKFKTQLPKLRFLDREGVDKDFIESYNKNAPQWSNEPDNRTEAQIKWWRSYCHRDLAEEVLTNIAYSNDEQIILQDHSDFGNDAVMCEWIYIVDLKQNKLIVKNDLQSEWKQEFDLDNLPTKEEFLKTFNQEED